MESRMSAVAGGEGEGVKELSKKDKGLMDVDNCVGMAGGGEYKGAKWQWKKIQ